MILDDIGDYLSSQGGATWTSGTNLFLGMLPDKPDLCTVVYESGGRGPAHVMGVGPNTSIVEMPRIQVVCRAVVFDYATARTTAHAAFKLLDGLPTRAINGVNYLWGAAVQSPFLMGRDEVGRVLVACNYDIIKGVSP